MAKTETHHLNLRMLTHHLTEHIDRYATALQDHEPSYRDMLRNHYEQIYHGSTPFNVVPILSFDTGARQFLHDLQGDARFEPISALSNYNLCATPIGHAKPMDGHADINPVIHEAAQKHGFDPKHLGQTLLDISFYRKAAGDSSLEALSAKTESVFLMLNSGGIPRLYHDANLALYEDFSQRRQLEKSLKPVPINAQRSELEKLLNPDWPRNRKPEPPSRPGLT